MTDYPSRLLSRYAAPASEPVTLSEAKLFLKVDASADDTLITDLITAVRVAAEDYMRRSLITQSWKLAFDSGLAEEVPLPYGPVQSITSVTIFNSAGASSVVSSNAYHLDAAKAALACDSLITGFRIEIIYAAGFGIASDVPKPIKQALLTHIAALYDNRTGNVSMPLAAQAIYDLYREVRL